MVEPKRNVVAERKNEAASAVEGDVCPCGQHRMTLQVHRIVTLNRRWSGTKFGISIGHTKDKCTGRDGVLVVKGIAPNGTVSAHIAQQSASVPHHARSCHLWQFSASQPCMSNTTAPFSCMIPCTHSHA
jgi:hypothetical protein